MTVTKDIDRDGSAVTVWVPLAIKNRGCRKVVVSPDGQQSCTPARPRVDNTLMRAVVQAFHWRHQLGTGRFATVSELAAAENLNTSYVSHVLRLSMLAPDIVEGILDGRQPAAMQLQQLVRGLSVIWDQQRCQFRTYDRSWPPKADAQDRQGGSLARFGLSHCQPEPIEPP